ncbi:hypothetical protein MNEG_12483, partial [Monoraphidium neglectum]
MQDMQQLSQEMASLGLAGGEQRPGSHSSLPSHSNLYVNNLPYNISEQQVDELFAPYGEVISLRLVRASRMGPSTKTFAFVKYANVQVKGESAATRAGPLARGFEGPAGRTIRWLSGRPAARRARARPHSRGAGGQQAVAAIQGLNHSPCAGGAAGAAGLLEVKFADADAGDRNPELSAPPSDNLYCKNLPGSYTDDDLRALFAPHGNVIECKLLHRGDIAQGAGALVRLGSLSEAQRAIAGLHNQRLPGAAAPLVVRYADSAEQKAKKAARMGRAYDRWA